MNLATRTAFMLAPVLYALYFVLMGKWITEKDLEQAKQGLLRIYNDINIHADDNQAFFSNNGHGHGHAPPQYVPQFFEEQKHCFASSLFPHVYAFPPLPTLSMFLGFLFHAPCSIYYHLLCAYKLPSGPKRMTHWSRRLDQAMIHGMSVFHCLGYSGNVDYTLFVLAFSLDSMYRLFQGGVHRPRRILARMILAFILPILPLLSHGRILEFCQLLAIFATGGWLFSTYPFGGWSHGAFHIVLTLSNPITMLATTKLMASQEAIEIGAKCAILQNVGGVIGVGNVWSGFDF
eukprot:40043_1